LSLPTVEHPATTTNAKAQITNDFATPPARQSAVPIEFLPKKKFYFSDLLNYYYSMIRKSRGKLKKYEEVLTHLKIF
jgi:hypothetical protein